MILIDGIGRSGTSLLGRLLAMMLEPRGYRYFYEPMHHPTPVGTYPNWETMIGRVLPPGQADDELEAYIKRIAAAAPEGKALWKEIRMALKQDWLLARFPGLRIIHLTRDILGVLSSHRRPDAPDWMDNHRKIWLAALDRWLEEPEKLKKKKVSGIESFKGARPLSARGEFERYAAIWALNEGFAWRLGHPRMLCVEYEDLCLYPLETLKRIAAFLGAPFEQEAQDAALRHMRESGKTFDPAGPGAGRPLKEMPEIWRERLSAGEIGKIVGVAGATRQRLGYPAAAGIMGDGIHRKPAKP